jgi:hypothetical protein
MTHTLFDRAFHMEDVSNWLKVRELPYDVDDLPRLGVIVPGVAVGFLRRCEGSQGILDNYLTNPNAPAQERDEALSLITKTLISVAKSQGVKHLLAYTRDKNTEMRAKRFGFQSPPHCLLALDLT